MIDDLKSDPEQDERIQGVITAAENTITITRWGSTLKKETVVVL